MSSTIKEGKKSIIFRNVINLYLPPPGEESQTCDTVHVKACEGAQTCSDINQMYIQINEINNLCFISFKRQIFFYSIFFVLLFTKQVHMQVWREAALSVRATLIQTQLGV